jgi:serine/threonine protein kinase
VLQAQQVLQSRYQLVECLGENGGRQTWRAIDQAQTPPERVIVKALIFPNQVEWQALRLFEREGEILRTVSHPYIPQYRDFFTADDRGIWYCLVEDYIPGKSLKQLLDEGEHFTEGDLRSIGKQVLEILVYLHGLSPLIYHRDIKPSNLIRGEDSRIYLVDFGAVQDKAPVLGGTFTIVGTYGYTPIEQFAGRAVPGSDLYALGATLVHLATGRSPADLEQRDFRLQYVEYVSLPVPLLQWLNRMIEPDVTQRFGRADRALEGLQMEGGMTMQRQSRRSQPPSMVPKPLGTKIVVQNMGDRLVVSTDRRSLLSAWKPTFLALVVGTLLLLCVSAFIDNYNIMYGCFWFWFVVVIWFSCSDRRAWNISLDYQNYRIHEVKWPHLDRRINYRQGSLKEIQEILHHDVLPDKKSSAGLWVPHQVKIRTRRAEIQFGSNLTRHEAAWVVYELRNWIEQHT